MSLITFDWGQITTFNGPPLIYPWWVAANIGCAVVFFYWFLVPILYVSPQFSILWVLF
jgi:OPT oligopeptide transporter protein